MFTRYVPVTPAGEIRLYIPYAALRVTVAILEGRRVDLELAVLAGVVAVREAMREA